MDRSTQPTMKDVARVAGVALGTVSRVFNGFPVGEEYRRRVEDAADALGYQVNNYARGLKTNKTRCVALLMPSLNKIDGLGDSAASKIVDAVKDGPFLSLDNFRQRTECSKTIVDKLVSLGILEGLPESDQLSIFDLMNGMG